MRPAGAGVGCRAAPGPGIGCRAPCAGSVGPSGSAAPPPDLVRRVGAPSALTMLATVQQYQPNIDRQSAAALTTAQVQQLVNTVANKAPDVSAWFAPHLIEALLSLLLVALAAVGFQRFRNAFGA